MALIDGQRPGEFGLTLIVTDVLVAAQFYAEVFGAEEIRRHHAEALTEVPVDTVTGVEMRLSGVMLILAMQNPRFRDGKWIDARRTDWPRCPAAAGTTTASFSIYVDDVDATLAKALACGATLMHPSHTVENTHWGDRVIQFFDPMGHVWRIMTRLEDVEREDLPARYRALHRRTLPVRH